METFLLNFLTTGWQHFRNLQCFFVVFQIFRRKQYVEVSGAPTVKFKQKFQSFYIQYTKSFFRLSFSEKLKSSNQKKDIWLPQRETTTCWSLILPWRTSWWESTSLCLEQQEQNLRGIFAFKNLYGDLGLLVKPWELWWWYQVKLLSSRWCCWLQCACLLF